MLARCWSCANMGCHCMLPLQRPKKIAVRYQNLEGTEVEMELSGFPARVFQHEYDHLQVSAAPAAVGG